MKIAILVSGRGSNLQAIIDACIQGELSSKVVIVLSNKEEAYALKRAKNLGIKAEYFKEAELEKHIIESHADLIILAGYMKKIPEDLLNNFKGKIINIHPSLLPKFGGKGFYGMNVHRAVLADMRLDSNRGKKYFSGATIHFVNNEYDEGDIFLQEKVEITDCMSAEEIAKRVLEIEHKLLVKAVKKLEEMEER